MLARVLAIVVACLLLGAGRAQAANHDDTCVGWGIGGALIGVSVAYYGTAGVYAAATDGGLFDVPLPGVVGAEVVGLVGGPMLFCNLFSPEASFVPEASWVTAMGSVGLAVGMGAGYGFLRLTEPATAQDYVPAWRLAGAVSLAAAGAFGGGWLGHRLFDATHADMTAGVVVLPTPEALVVGMTGTF